MIFKVAQKVVSCKVWVHLLLCMGTLRCRSWNDILCSSIGRRDFCLFPNIMGASGATRIHVKNSTVMSFQKLWPCYDNKVYGLFWVTGSWFLDFFAAVSTTFRAPFILIILERRQKSLQADISRTRQLTPTVSLKLS